MVKFIYIKKHHNQPFMVNRFLSKGPGVTLSLTTETDEVEVLIKELSIYHLSCLQADCQKEGWDTTAALLGITTIAKL